MNLDEISGVPAPPSKTVEQVPAKALSYLAGITVLLVGLILWYLVSERIERTAQHQFEQDTQQVVNELSDSLRSNGDYLASLIVAAGKISKATGSFQWQGLLEEVRAATLPPSMNQLGLILVTKPPEIPPDSFVSSSGASSSGGPRFKRPPLLIRAQASRLPIVFIRDGAEPSDLLGKDLSRDSSILNATLKARDSGNATVVSLAALQSGNDAESLHLLVPFYRIESVATVRDRRHNFAGFLFSSLDIRSIISDHSSIDERYELNVSVGDTLLVGGENSDHEDDSDNRLIREIKQTLFGKEWTFDFTSRSGLSTIAISSLPLSVLVATAFLTMLFLTVVRMNARQNRLVRQRSAQALNDMERQLSEAQRVRADLESFAYIVSHDLKAPLRGIATLTELIEEDLLDPELEYSNRVESTAEYLARLNQQITRMKELINGIHDYSTGDSQDHQCVEVDTRETVLSVGRLLSIDSDALKLSGDFPTFRTLAVPFRQTMANLIGNAIKYHDNPEEARVEVSVSNFGDFYVFAVSDNGPGIDPVHHSRIFEVFEGVRKPGVESTGVGLSIVKKAVESLGGMIEVESELGKGATFRFTWPKSVD